MYHQWIPSSRINVKTKKSLFRRLYDAKNHLIFFSIAQEHDVLINASNIFGYGAVQLSVSNLLEELQYKHRSVIVIVPDKGVLSKFHSKHSRVFNTKDGFHQKYLGLMSVLYTTDFVKPK